MAKLGNDSKGYSNLGSLDCESGILPLSDRDPQGHWIMWTRIYTFVYEWQWVTGSETVPGMSYLYAAVNDTEKDEERTCECHQME